MLNRRNNFKVTMHTKVCSNHFTAGYCSDMSPIPMLYMKKAMMLNSQQNVKLPLIGLTPSGTVLYMSKTYYGDSDASDHYITETSRILDKVKPGESLMAEKGFSISDLLVGKG